MLSKDLNALLNKQQEQEQQPEEMRVLMQKLRGKAFYYWGSGKTANHKQPFPNSACCFNHIIGLPSKNGEEKPLFDYELVLYKALMENVYLNSNIKIDTPSAHTFAEREQRRKMLQTATYSNGKNKHLWVLKATGLGVTEFMLRFMVWLCLRNDDYKGSQMVIVTGPNQDIAIKLIKRMKAMFEPFGITFDSKETVIELNGCSIEAYPSNHIDAFRSLTNPKFILIDEGDFFRKNEQEEVRHVAERYIGKSDPYIVMVSTPNAPQGLFEKIQKEPFETCIYKKVFLDCSFGVGKMYTKEEIERAKMSPSFKREYMLEYQGLIGNVFSHASIERCQKLEYNPDRIVQDAKKSIGIDPSFGSSKFGIVVTQYVNERIEVIIAEEHDRPHFEDMINRVWEIKNQCGLMSAIYVDAANPEIWQSLKREFNETYSEKYVSEKLLWCRKHNADPANYMLVIPTPFSVENAKMLQHAKSLIEDPDNLIAIHPSFDKLLTSLRTAVATDYKLDKEQTSYHDILDAFRLSLQFYKRGK